ncbi:MAG TPA: YjgP/YjgQ family permease [Candidatus Latescibacteria bacterium]|nr:YjgP/YjgQ family permease [Candidatus Latescibacterota bacterium]
MRILYGYILKEHIGPFLFGFFVITFIFIIDLILQVMDLLLRKGIGIITTLELFSYNLAWMIALSVPMAILVACLMAFGRLSADNEIAAIKASGVSLYRLILPVLLVSTLIAILLVIFNNRILPESNHRARILMSAIYRKKPTLSLKDKEGVFINELPGYSILIDKVDEYHSKIYGITIYKREGKGYPVAIRAKRGEVSFSNQEDRLTLILYDGEVHQIDRERPDTYIRTKFQKHVINIFGVGERLYVADSKYRGDREMSSKMMLEQVAQYRRQIKIHEEKTKKLRDLQDRRKAQRIQAHLNEIEILKRKISKYLVEVHKKYSIPVACIVFVLVGAPLGIMGRRGGIVVGFGMSIGFFILYWAFLIGGEELADRLIIPPALAMWAPNVIIGAGGIYLIVHTVRELTFIHWERIKGFFHRREA